MVSSIDQDQQVLEMIHSIGELRERLIVSRGSRALGVDEDWRLPLVTALFRFYVGRWQG